MVIRQITRKYIMFFLYFAHYNFMTMINNNNYYYIHHFLILKIITSYYYSK